MIPLPVEVVAIPARPEAADGGAALAARWDGAPRIAWLTAAERELAAGNLPERLRTFWPVTLSTVEHTVVVWVSPDYLAVGSDADALPIPLGFPAAARVALGWGLALPTPPVVDAVVDQAVVRGEPVPLPPGPEMAGLGYVLAEAAAVRAQGLPPDGLTAGTKKDVVLTPALRDHPAREAIYGWHRRDGGPIQPLSLWHRASYSDYSHGIRLVYGEVWADGERRGWWDALADPELGPILTGAGALPDGERLLRAAAMLPVE